MASSSGSPTNINPYLANINLFLASPPIINPYQATINPFLASPPIINPYPANINPFLASPPIINPYPANINPFLAYPLIINPSAASIAKELQNLRPLSKECCIYKVPLGMRASNDVNFTPQVVSIGPIHYRNSKLMATENMKIRYLAEFLTHSGLRVDQLLLFISQKETRLRNCYAHVIDLDSETFVKMVLEDAVFLVMILLYNSFGHLQSTTDRLFGKPNLMYDIRDDLTLLENQLPLFILVDLYKLSKLHDHLRRVGRGLVTFDEETAMPVLAYRFLKTWIALEFPERHPPSAEHILDLFRRCCIPANWSPQRTKVETANIPSMTELYQAGVKIRVGSNENMFDIRFHGGVLEIPPIKIYDSTERMIRNLLALETCHCPGTHQFFAQYVEMMRLFTVSSEDTELLMQKKVICNGLGNAQLVSTLFQNIDAGNIINFDCFLYGDVIEGLNDYYKVWHHRWLATWRIKYIKAPWAICSLFAAAFALLLTTVGTVFAILNFALR